jgi:Kef-type K+ transport system membrane component KefB
MEVHQFFLQLTIILLAARVLAELASRLQMPSVIGELLAGVILGPSLLGWIEPTEVIELLAEIGVILLLFEVGLETDIYRLIETGWKSLLLALGGFVFPLVLGFGLSLLVFDLPLLVALFVGGTLTATSIGITVRVLADLKRQQSHEAQIVIGAAVLDDILGVVLLALLYQFSTEGGVSFATAGKVLLFIVLFLIGAPIVAKLIALVIKRFAAVSEIPGLIPTMMVALILSSAWLAHEIGAPVLLGGFAAGLVLSQPVFLPFGIAIRGSHEFEARIEAEMKPIIHLFTPIFFVMVGLSLDLRAVDWGSPFIWNLSLLLVAVAVAGKLAGAFLVKEPLPARWALGLAMVPRGEVGLVFAELGRASGIFNAEIYAALILVVALTTLLPPFALRWFYSRYGQTIVKPQKLENLRIEK